MLSTWLLLASMPLLAVAICLEFYLIAQVCWKKPPRGSPVDACAVRVAVAGVAAGGAVAA